MKISNKKKKNSHLVAISFNKFNVKFMILKCKNGIKKRIKIIIKQFVLY